MGYYTLQAPTALMLPEESRLRNRLRGTETIANSRKIDIITDIVNFSLPKD
jgi:hypothetical protein